MSGEHAGPGRASRLIRAAPDALYGGFMGPAALVAWLPPAQMTGKMHAFEARVGGYRTSLFYPSSEPTPRGKTTAGEDMVSVRFVEFVPGRRIVEAVSFEPSDPALLGEMTIVMTFEEAPGGTDVMILCNNLPPGLRPDENEAASRLSSSSWRAASNEGRPAQAALTPRRRPTPSATARSAGRAPRRDRDAAIFRDDAQRADHLRW
jgi:uncharacterized protein YndB with AHSA1/START domain